MIKIDFRLSHVFTLKGKPYQVSGTDTMVVENLSIQRFGACVIYLAAPKGQQSTACTLIERRMANGHRVIPFQFRPATNP